jgi:KDO2-lipid IV(A) lauroyltransferase
MRYLNRIGVLSKIEEIYHFTENHRNIVTMPIKNMLSTTFCLRAAIWSGKILSRKTGLALANHIGTLLGKQRKSDMVQAIRANQWVIHDQDLSREALDAFPKIIFRSAARCMFDYFYYLARPEKLQNVIRFSPDAHKALERIRDDQPTVIVCPHLSNFDLMGFALALNNINVQVLSFPNPNASYQLQNQLREGVGIEVTPMSLSAFRQARQRLRNGGSILTGLDRPLPENLLDKYHPVFFGHPTNLPVTYVRMAREAGAPVIIMAATSHPGGRYILEGSAPIWMDSAKSLETEILTNANKVLREAEQLIRKYARQWAMFYPVWPQFLGV